VQFQYFPVTAPACAQLIPYALMKITRNQITDTVPDAARFALFLNVFVRQPVPPRRGKVRVR
jgi:hypothetical protein